MWADIEHLKLLLEVALLVLLGWLVVRHAAAGRLTAALNAGINAT